jgi:hypothetical protein
MIQNTQNIEVLQAASERIAEVAVPIAETLGTAAAAIALVNVTMQLLVQTHPKAEIVLWFRQQADQLEASDIASVGGTA